MGVNARDQRFLNRTQMLLRGLYSSGLCVMYHDLWMNVRLVENTPAAWPSPDAVLSGGDGAIFDPETAERVIEAKCGVLASGVAARVEAAVYPLGSDAVWFDLDIEADRDEDGRVSGLFVSASDISGLKRREDTLRALLFEVSHRSRNLLAILQSILGHTARSSDSIGEFERKFRGRIASLALSQDLVTFSNWEGVLFQRLIEGQLDRFFHYGDPPHTIRGANPMLTPNSALHLGLALHELAANSAAFGVIAADTGEITIEIGVNEAGVSLSWREDHVSPREPDSGRGTDGSRTANEPIQGFGRAILEQVVPRAVDGKAIYEIGPQHISYRIDWPEKLSAAAG